jgi:PAP2 superfamily
MDNSPLTRTAHLTNQSLWIAAFAGRESKYISRDTGLKLVITSAVAILGVALISTRGLSFSLRELAGPLGVLATLGPCAVFYHKRQSPQFVMTLLALMQLIVFTSCFTVAMYGVASLGAPLADGLLAAADGVIGIHVPSIVDWAGKHPQINDLLMFAYNSVIPQTLLVVLILGFLGRRRQLETFVLRYLICLVITLLFFVVIPAIGPYSYYGFAPTPHQLHYVEHLIGARTGERTIVSLSDCEGLITFPSFHTSYAILLASAFWDRRLLFVPFAILNGAVIVATVTSGWHYGIDILGGTVTIAVTFWITNHMQSWLYPTIASLDTVKDANLNKHSCAD